MLGTFLESKCHMAGAVRGTGGECRKQVREVWVVL